jgi:hypothetical protein
MNWTKIALVVGGVVVASVVDLVYMFWSRSPGGARFGRSIWNSSMLGKGHYNVMGVAKHLSYKDKKW